MLTFDICLLEWLSNINVCKTKTNQKFYKIIKEKKRKKDFMHKKHH